ncbi:MAG: hypothetical protein CMH82_07065, partial [Nocardioides sp.]|nr:hypothetical protein [Nocardioides sp.]
MLAVLTPRYWGAHLLALVLVAAAAGLGWWQYDSYQARRAAEAVDLTQAAPLPITDVMGPDDRYPGDRVGQPVTVEGTWVPTGTVLVSGRRHEGRDGYWVVTPLAVGGADAPALPVVLGWTADPDEAPAPPRGDGAVVGWLQPTDGTGETDTDRTDDVIPQVRTADLIQHVEQDLYGAYAVLDHDRSPVVPGADALWAEVYRRAGMTLSPVNVGCCGMCGAYGHETHHESESRGIFDMSWARALADLPPARVLATGFSCRHQTLRC